jgi:hypothetical protein
MLFAGVARLVAQHHAVLGHHMWQVCCKQFVDSCVTPCEIQSRAPSLSLSASGTIGDALNQNTHLGDTRAQHLVNPLVRGFTHLM